VTQKGTRIMSKDAPTLIDKCLRETYRSMKKGSMVPSQIRGSLLRAKRFVLDETASSFLSDLGH